MSWLFESWDDFLAWLPILLGFINLFLIVVFLTWVLMTKSDSTSAVAWSLLIIFIPFAGALFFLLFGNQHIDRPLSRKRRHNKLYRRPPNPANYDSSTLRPGASNSDVDTSFRKAIVPGSLNDELSRLAHRLGAYSVTLGNAIDFYTDGAPAFDAMLEAIRNARHHIHMMFFIYHGDELGRLFLDALTARARAGVQVRFLYDAMGSRGLSTRLLRPLRQAGGQASAFLPVNPLRRRIQVNLRNHRKIVVVDGAVGFIGGLNIGDEYAGKNPYFGYWRDTHLRVQGPSVVDLQRIFLEDWSFATNEDLSDREAHRYFPAKLVGGPYPVQVIESGPDREMKAIRELTFAAILKARRRVWIASPYFVPDPGLLDALRLAAYEGLDVRYLGLLRPDHWLPYFAARYYWTGALRAGIKIYQYARGMMHSKVMLIDDEFASVGTANLDYRSMFLNFEANCLIYSQQAVKILEEQFLRDFQDSIALDRAAYARRSFGGRLLENACRLLSPIL